MKTITIRLPDVEAAMLVEVQKRYKELRALDKFFVALVRRQYSKIRVS